MAKKKGQPRRLDSEALSYTDSMDDALEVFTAAAQCGSCYQWYDAAESQSCPLCDSDEIVGDR
jgi:hypothetical protein